MSKRSNRFRTDVAMSGAASLAIVVGAGLIFPVQALAQTAPADSSKATQLGEVVVTAERRTENLQRVPISATVLDGSQLKADGVYNVQDLQYQTPGLSIQPPVSSETFINIRGVGLQQTNPASSNGVAFYVDGQYVPTLIDTVDSFYDLQNVEVLRGPQGTLVGSNADGGAIFVNSVKPSFDATKGYIQQTFGNYNERRTEGAINVPLSSMFAARVAFVYETRDSFYTNVGTSAPNAPGNVDFEAMRLQLTFKPSNAFEATVRYEPYESRTDGFAVKPDMVAFGAASGTNPVTNPGYDPAAAAIQNQPFKINYNLPQYYNILGQRTSLNAMWHITDGIAVKSVTSYQTGHESDLTDIDASSANLMETRTASFNTFTQEINLLSTSSGPLSWVVGAYYLDESAPLVLQFTNPAPLHSLGLNLVADHTNEAVFASATYKFSSQWGLTLGARYSHDDQPFHEKLCTGFPQPCGNYSTSDNETTGSAKLTFQATPDTLVYASIANGYKAGGTNLQIPDIGFTPPAFRPETNVVEELGVKTTLFDHHLRVDLAGFDSQYDNYQLQEFLGGLPATQGPGNAVIYGAEAEVTGVFSALKFNLGLAYLHGAVSGGGFNFLGYGFIKSGTAIPYAPEWTASAGVQYDFHVWDGVLTPRLQYQYQDSQYTIMWHTIQTYDNSIPSHGTADFHLTYTSSAHWSVEAYVTNLTDKTYLSGVNQNPQAAAADLSYGPPRQFGTRLSYKF